MKVLLGLVFLLVSISQAGVIGNGTGYWSGNQDAAYRAGFTAGSTDAKNRCQDNGYGYDWGSATLHSKSCETKTDRYGDTRYRCNISVNMDCK